jgi:protein tyrosine/serine phosphatase
MVSVYDDPNNYPMLIHCKAGLHRTGLLAALYRVEYQGWTVNDAYREMKAQGFGDKACTEANLYVKQYLLDYQPRWQESQVHQEIGQQPCSP